MKIFQKLLLTVLGVALLPLIGASVITALASQNTLRSQIQTRISNTAEHQLGRIGALNDQANTQLNTLQNKAQLRILLQEYEQQANPELQASLNQSLQDILSAEDTFHRMYLVNPQGRVVAATDEVLIGKSYKTTQVWRVASKAPTSNIFFKNTAGTVDQYLAVPLSFGGQSLGVLIVEATAAPYLSVTKDYSELGLTGESYLVRPAPSGQLQYLTPLRFDPAAALTTESHPANYRTDYRGHNVLLSTRNVPGTDWKLVVKIDIAEVDAPLVRMRRLLFMIATLAAVLAIVVALYLSRFMTGPIKRFTEVVAKIRGGDMQQRVRIESRDEIGTLGTAFNEMTDSLLESRARLIASVLGLSQGFIMTSRERGIVTINDAARRLLSIAPEAAVDTLTLGSAFARIEEFNVEQYVQQCLQQKQPLEVRDAKAHGSFFNIFLSPIMLNGEANGVVVLISDETEEKIIQRSRDEFFSIASHELRTPLTAIRGNTETILSYYKEQLKDPDLAAMITDMYDSSIRLINIVNDFLDMSSLEQGKASFTIAPFDAATLTSQAISAVRTEATAKNLPVKLVTPKTSLPPVLGDQERVQKILVALLDNAIKFTERGKITVTLTVVGSALHFDVNDTGRGISPEAQKLLFHKFQQATSSILTRDDTSATGLGLYISRLLAQGMQGTLYLNQTEPGKGTTFTLELPLDDSSVTVAQAKAKLPAKAE